MSAASIASSEDEQMLAFDSSERRRNIVPSYIAPYYAGFPLVSAVDCFLLTANRLLPLYVSCILFAIEEMGGKR